MKNIRLFQLATAVTTIMGIAAACSFPDPRLVPDADGGGGGTDSGEDVSNPIGEGGGPDVGDGGGGGVELDAPLAFDATSEKPPVDANGCFCDCDKDGFRSKDQDAMACDAGVKEGDCDDLDNRAYPDAGYVYDLPTNDTKGDWNCDGKYSLEHQLSFKCGDHSSLLGAGCAVSGFQAAEVGCGVESTTWVSCKAPIVAGACQNNTSEKRTQGCK